MDFSSIWLSKWLLLESFETTLLLSAIAIAVGTLIGACVSVMRALNISIINFFLLIYIEVFRGTPLLMQLFFVYFGLPMLGIQVDKNALEVIVLFPRYSLVGDNVLKQATDGVKRNGFQYTRIMYVLTSTRSGGEINFF